MTTNQVVFFIIFILLIILSLIIIYRGFNNKLIKIRPKEQKVTNESINQKITNETEGLVRIEDNNNINRLKELNEGIVVTPDNNIDTTSYSGIPEPRAYIVGKGEKSNFSDSFEKIKNLYKYKYER